MSVVQSVITKRFVEVDGNAKIIRPADTVIVQFVTIEFSGSSMTGSDGDVGRTYTHTGAISPSAKVYVGSVGGGLMRLSPSKWSVAGNVITIDVAVYDADVVNVDQ